MKHGLSSHLLFQRRSLTRDEATHLHLVQQISGEVPMMDGAIIGGTIEEQTHQTIANLLAIVKEACYKQSDIVRCGAWLEDARDFFPFNSVFSQVFGEHLPARTSIVASMVIGCKVAMDCIAYKVQA